MKHKKIGILLLCAAAALGVMFTSCDMDGDEDGAITIYGCDPDSGIIGEALTIAITGDALSEEVSPGKQVSLILGSTVISGTNVNVVTGGQINVDFDLTGATIGSYTVYITDEEGDEQTFPDGFTVSEYEVVQDALADVQTIDIGGAGGEIAYDFSVNADCVLDSDARDVTFSLDGATDPAITITAAGSGGKGGIVYYAGGFTSLGEAVDVEHDYANYAREGDGSLPFPLEAGQYYSLIDVADHFIILEIVDVDKTNDTVDINYMIIRKIAVGTL